MRILFILIILFHGLIHILGFIKAFAIADIKELSQYVSKSSGIFWLIAFLFFILIAFLYGIKDNYWCSLSFAAILVSQILIIYFWKDAKFGTLPNIIILFVAIAVCANYNFQRMTSIEIRNILSKTNNIEAKIITNEMITHLPESVQNWLSNSGIMGKLEINNVFLKQNALMKMKPEQVNWKEAKAEQYFTTRQPAFVWTVNIKMMPLIDVVGRDKFKDGEGEMLIKILSLIPVVNSKSNDKINSGSLQRYLGEIVWFPSAALSPNITWEEIDAFSARATMTYKGTTGSGIFSFDKNGNFKKYTAKRYRGGEKVAQLTDWVIKANESKVVNGIKIPVKMTATWKLDDGDWTWLKLEVTEISYNVIKE